MQGFLKKENKASKIEDYTETIEKISILLEEIIDDNNTTEISSNNGKIDNKN